MKAILLVRVSTQVQDLVQQRNIVIEAALKDGYTRDNLILIEDKESASRLSEEERNGLTKLKEYITNDSEINCVYTYEISRISRKSLVFHSIRDFLIKHNVQLVILNPYCKMLNDDGTISTTANIYFGIFGAMAENETMVRKGRTERGIKKLIAEGKHGRGRALFGYDVDKDKYYIPHSENAEIVKTIFRLYNKGLSIRNLAIEMQERGYFKHVTFSDLQQRVFKILKDKRYTGIKPYPALIDKTTYETSVTLRNERRIEYNIPTIYICKGILKDKNTGQTLSPKKTLNRYATVNLNRLPDFKQVSISFDIIEPLILEYAIRHHKEYIKTYSVDVVGNINHNINVLQQKIQSLQDKIDNLTASRDKIEERLILGRISDEKANELEDKITKEINDTNNSIAIFKEKIKHLEETLNNTHNNKEIDYDNLSKEEQVELIKSVVNMVLISKTNKSTAIIEIHNNFNENVEIRKFVTYGRYTREIVD